MSKLGLHIISWNQSQGILEFIARSKPRVVKMLEFNDMNTDVARASSPGTLFIGRQYVDSQPLDNPAQNARDFFNRLLPAIHKMGSRIDVWEGYNEIVVNSVDIARRYNDFTVAWAGLMHAQGLRCAAYSFSVANPELSYWPYLAGGARACDFLALHEYDSPRMDASPGQMCLRYRKVRQLLPVDARRPILITECGIDDGHNLGWKTYASGDSYISQLGWYDAQLMQDDYVVGGTIFTIDGRDWANFDVQPILRPIAEYVISHPSPPPPPPPPPPTPTAVISNVTIAPTLLYPGQLLQISVKVTNTSKVTLQTQGPEPGFIYDETDTFYTRGFPDQADAFRVGIDFDGHSGIDHPFRWGLGSSLAPGASVIVTGAIRVNTIKSVNCWAGLVRERVSWLQDNQCKTIINIKTPPPPGSIPTITAVSFQPSSLTSGQLFQVSITVQNTTANTLDSIGPDPGFVYEEGDTFYTRGFAEIYGVYRVGIDFDGRSQDVIDHPYRWGLGAPLAPGATATITGSIRLKSNQSRSYWAGLVRERVAWLQDKQGARVIAVTGGPNPAPGQPQITAVTLSPARIHTGDVFEVRVTVVNNSAILAATQGPDSGFTYNDGENFTIRGLPPIAGAWRVGVDFDLRTGIDHPYRWGLGGTLPPGQSTTVIGYVRLNQDQVKRFWVGLVKELVVWQQDVVGVTEITAGP